MGQIFADVVKGKYKSLRMFNNSKSNILREARIEEVPPMEKREGKTDKDIKEKCKQAKYERLNEKCAEIEI